MKLLSCLFLTLSLMTGYAASVTVYRGSDIVDAKGMVVGPYPGSVNGQGYDLFCDDAAHDIVAQDSVKMTVSTLSDLSHTRFGKKMNAEVMYEQIFYLSTYLLSPPNRVPYTSDTDQPVAADIQARSGATSTRTPMRVAATQ